MMLFKFNLMSDIVDVCFWNYELHFSRW